MEDAAQVHTGHYHLSAKSRHGPDEDANSRGRAVRPRAVVPPYRFRAWTKRML